MKRALSSAPVFLQVIGLVLAAVVAAQAVNFGVVLFAPAPLPTGFSVSEAARALRGETVDLADGGTLRARVVEQAPAFRSGFHAPLQQVIAGAVGRELKLPADAVRVEVRPPRGAAFEHRVRVQALRDGPTDTHRMTHEQFVMRILRHGDARGGDARHESMEIAADNLLFPPFAAAIRRPDGRWLLVEPPHRWMSPWRHRLMLTFALTAVLLAPLAWLLARGLTRPIRTFAAAAERLGADPGAPPLAAEGPAEVRTAIGAFNDMQDKLRGHLEGRTAMLAAIAHDLRTPLTRLRFHAESTPPALREKIAADIGEMDAMIASVLAFVRAGRRREDWAVIDLSSLVAASVEDLVEVGGVIRLDAHQVVRVRGDALALKRLVVNLADNALKFAGAAEAELTVDGADAVLTISDRGPGLPESELERAFEPFHRLEPSRSRDTGGVGLGLATARAIAREHGGDVTLENRPGGELVAVLRLPAAA